MMAAGQVREGMAASAEGKSTQAMAEYNAKLQEREAKNIEAKTQYEQRKQAEYADRELSSMRAGLGTSGVVSTTGSPLLVQAKQASEFEITNIMMGQEGIQQAMAARSGAALSRLEGKIARQRAKNLASASYLSAGGTALSGFGSMSGAFGGKSVIGDSTTGMGLYGDTGGGGPTGGGSRSMIG
jgi:hypothetical protein